LHLGIVRREEQYLEREFGDVSRNYKAQTARYLPFIS
jgi:protein-S-isoprenylcysteine O-methyltransferase Ste14